MLFLKNEMMTRTILSPASLLYHSGLEMKKYTTEREVPGLLGWLNHKPKKRKPARENYVATLELAKGWPHIPGLGMEDCVVNGSLPASPHGIVPRHNPGSVIPLYLHWAVLTQDDPAHDINHTELSQVALFNCYPCTFTPVPLPQVYYAHLAEKLERLQKLHHKRKVTCRRSCNILFALWTSKLLETLRHLIWND